MLAQVLLVLAYRREFELVMLALFDPQNARLFDRLAFAVGNVSPLLDVALDLNKPRIRVFFALERFLFSLVLVKIIDDPSRLLDALVRPSACEPLPSLPPSCRLVA